MSKIGFTGTQRGMTRRQVVALRQLMTGATELHHGDCIGADAQADAIARIFGVPVVIHPPENPSKRAFTAQGGDTVWQPLPYLERNHDIVDECDVLIAAPKTPNEELRSGTWATVRYARRIGRPVNILTP